MKGYKILLWKAYFDKGLNLTNYFKYLLVAFGALQFSTGTNLKLTFFITFVYIIFCVLLGRWFMTRRYMDTEVEIINMFNPFVSDVRKKLKVK
jgi:hypothetical protein